MTNITETLLNDMCIGCGVCSGVCPNNAIKINWNESGEYKPTINPKSCVSCGICKKVCPNIQADLGISDVSKTLFGYLQSDEYIGFYKNIWVGNNTDEILRLQSASGGMCSLVLRGLLDKKFIDSVISVKPTGKNGRLFMFKEINTSSQIDGGSAYYPLEISQILENIINGKEKKYAIVVLPCVAYAIRKAQLQNKVLNRRIKYVLSLVCGQLQNKQDAEYVASKNGVEVKNLNKINYRTKIKDKPSSEFEIRFKGKHGQKGSCYYSECAHYWSYSYFKHNICNYCDDIYAECADATFMDAWLPKYEKDWKGNTITVVRNKDISELMQKLSQEGLARLSDISAEETNKSQQGRINNKRELIKGRLYYLKKNGIDITRRSVAHEKVFKQNKFNIIIKSKIQEKSKEFWKQVRLKPNNIKLFKRKMSGFELKIILHRYFESLVRHFNFKCDKLK